MDEKGVQVMTETGTMSAKGSIVTDCHSLLYTGVKKEIFFTLAKLMKIENTFSFQIDVAYQLLLVLMQSRKLAPDRQTASCKFPGVPVVSLTHRTDCPVNCCQPLPLRIDKSKFSVYST